MIYTAGLIRELISFENALLILERSFEKMPLRSRCGLPSH